MMYTECKSKSVGKCVKHLTGSMLLRRQQAIRLHGVQVIIKTHLTLSYCKRIYIRPAGKN